MKEQHISTALPATTTFNNYSGNINNVPSSDSLFSGIIKSLQTTNLNTMNNFDGSIIGSFIPNKNGFNIRAALQYGVSHVNQQSLGKCAKYVRMMLNAGGINTAGNPVAAKDYTMFLPSKGFKHITTLNGVNEQNDWTQRDAIAGDIAVMSKGSYGHICMYTGKYWISDFVQTKMWPYTGNGICNIFRFQ